MEICVNEYIRTKDGLLGEYCEYKGFDYIELKDKTLGIDIEKDIKKHSFNIIDLIEVGDYVNGHKVVDIYTDLEDFGDGCTGIEVESDLQAHKLLTKKHIKSIVTKQQLASVEYKLDN